MSEDRLRNPKNGHGRRFHAWAAAVRACAAIQALAQESWEMEQALERLRRSPNPDPATIRKVTLDLRARRFEVERVIAALPSLDEIGRTGRAGGPASARRPAGGGGPSAPGSTGGTT